MIAFLQINDVTDKPEPTEPMGQPTEPMGQPTNQPSTGRGPEEILFSILSIHSLSFCF